MYLKLCYFNFLHFFDASFLKLPKSTSHFVVTSGDWWEGEAKTEATHFRNLFISFQITQEFPLDVAFCETCADVKPPNLHHLKPRQVAGSLLHLRVHKTKQKSLSYQNLLRKKTLFFLNHGRHHHKQMSYSNLIRFHLYKCIFYEMWMNKLRVDSTLPLTLSFLFLLIETSYNMHLVINKKMNFPCVISLFPV